MGVDPNSKIVPRNYYILYINVKKVIILPTKYFPGMRLGPHNILMLERLGSNKGRFQCPYCKNENWTAQIGRVVSGRSSNCGCHHPNNVPAVSIGDRFGKLTIIGDAGYKPHGNTGKNRHFSLCQCDCGSEPIEVMDNMLKNGNKVSCGCLISKGEFYIKQFLDSKNILYEQEKEFDDLVSPHSKKLLRFDFYLPQYNTCIEFQGRQHTYGPDTQYWSRTTDTLEKIQERDQTKVNYCKNKNIDLIIINYTEIKHIEEILSERLGG